MIFMDLSNFLKELEELSLRLEDDKFLSFLKLKLDALENVKSEVLFFIGLIRERIIEIENKNKPIEIKTENMKSNEQKNVMVLEDTKIVLPNLFKMDKSENPEETIEKMDIESLGKGFDFPYPPVALLDKDLNTELLKMEIPLENYLFFRYITHPYKRDVSIGEQMYIYYFAQSYGMDLLYIKYLLKGTGAEKLDWDKIFAHYDSLDNDDPIFDEVSDIEIYMDMLKIVVENNKTDPRINFIITENEISIHIKAKKTIFQNDVSKSYFEQFMRLYGFLYIPFKQK